MELLREPFECGQARGFRYGDVPAGIDRKSVV